MSAFESRTLSLSMRCYRGLLRAYPRSFLLEFEDLLCQAFGDLAHRAVRTKGHWGLFLLWMRTIPDLISSALSQRFRSNSEWRFHLRWILGCTAGAVFGVIVMFALRIAVESIQQAVGVMVVPRSVNLVILQLTGSFGLVLGWFQSRAIGGKRSRRAAWAISTMLGAAATAGLVMLIPIVDTYLRVTIHPWRLVVDHHPVLYYGGSAMVCVSVLGMLQALVLARRNPRALAWIPASALGVLACSLPNFFANPYSSRNHSPLTIYLVLGLIVGSVYGLITVLPLEWILRPRIARAGPDGVSKLPS